MLHHRIALVGIEADEYQVIKQNYDGHIIWHEAIPKILVKDGTLFVEKQNGIGMLPVDKVVYYGIYDNDFDFITGLALWNGACFPNPLAMLECRLKIPCLIKAMQLTKFPHQRGFVSANTEVNTNVPTVAKWGNWHCGENKEKFQGEWTSSFSSTLEPYFEGDAVRIMNIGDTYWQIKLEGEDWLKSIHPDNACFMEIDQELLADTKHIKQHLGMDMIGNDYIVMPNGAKKLLEVNHIPNITRFEEVRQAYLETVINWINNET
ncbi:hypothetical protein [Flavobacterium sp.]|uniref:hypothetical protein n=1 Tax=Flavobacterium sp. TaxID=239 RepID=UPI003D14D241